MILVTNIRVAEGHSNVDHLDDWVQEADAKLSGKEFRSVWDVNKHLHKICASYDLPYSAPRAYFDVEYVNGTTKTVLF